MRSYLYQVNIIVRTTLPICLCIRYVMYKYNTINKYKKLHHWNISLQTRFEWMTTVCSVVNCVYI